MPLPAISKRHTKKIMPTMKKRSPRLWLTAMIIASCLLSPRLGRSAGVTLVTHGFEEDGYPDWVTAMAEQIANYPTFPGTNFTAYRLVITYDNGYFYSVARTNGAPPLTTDTGEIFVELDWSQLSGDIEDSYASTYGVASAVAYNLVQTNLVPELGGHALAEFPLHLIGHSRGGSLVAELSRQLGTNGLWIDHLTTLDPYPLNNDGNDDLLLASVVDAPAHYVYENVLFADNYWQDLGAGLLALDPDGESVSGAYNRQLTDLDGGYGDNSTYSIDHSNVHLWYFGTLDLDTPASDGPGGASVGAFERVHWWNLYEDQGLFAGFYYSRIGGGDWSSTNRPLGSGYPAVVDGYNQYWNLGAGQTNNNRTLLPANSGAWPNLIRFDRADTNAVAAGQSFAVNYTCQWVSNSTAAISIYLDTDLNPLNSNETLLTTVDAPGVTAPNLIYTNSALVTLPAANLSSGWHTLFAQITGGGRSRYLYAPQSIFVAANQPLTLDIAPFTGGQPQVGVTGVPGQKIILQSSQDLSHWQPIATNTLATARVVFPLAGLPSGNMQFFRALLAN